MASITIYLADDEGNALPNKTVWLRRKNDANFGNNSYQMSDVVGEPGAYQFTGNFVTDRYKVWVEGNEDKAFGGDDGIEVTRQADIVLKGQAIDMSGQPITNLPVPATDSEPETKGRVATFLTTVATNLTNAIATCLLKAGGTMAGAINMNGNRIQNLPIPGGDADPLRKQDGIIKTTGADPQQIYSQLIFRESVPFILTQAEHLLHATNRKFVEDFCQRILNGFNPSAYQQSGNRVRVLFSGTQEDNKVYTTMLAGINNANSFAAADREMIVEVEGNGVSGAVAVDCNLIPVPGPDPFVHINGVVPNVVLKTAEDTYTGVLGQNIISNCTIDNIAEDASTTMEEYIFINVKFKNSFGSGNPHFVLSNCWLINCQSEGVGVGGAGIKGRIFDITNQKEIILADIYNTNNTFKIIHSVGDVQPRRLLGRKGADVVAAAKITLGDGNYFTITGNANIDYIVNTNWEAGSVIELEFSGTPNLKDTTLPVNADEAGIIPGDGGGDLAIAASSVVGLMLVDNKNFWRVLYVRTI